MKRIIQKNNPVTNFLKIRFLNISNINLNIDLQGISAIALFLVQIIVLLELIFALSKFFNGVIGVYVSFRAKNLRESVFYLLSRGKNDE